MANRDTKIRRRVDIHASQRVYKSLIKDRTAINTSPKVKKYDSTTFNSEKREEIRSGHENQMNDTMESLTL